MRISVAIVMPEIGFDEVPISPVMRDDTVAKKNPKIRIRTAARALPCVGRRGVTVRNTASSSDPPRTTVIGMSRSVRSRAGATAPAARSLETLARRGDDRRDRAAERDQARRRARRRRRCSGCTRSTAAPGAISEIRNGWPVAGLFAKFG